MIPSIRKGTGQKWRIYQPLSDLLKACVLLFWITHTHDTSYNEKENKKILEVLFHATTPWQFLSGKKKYLLFFHTSTNLAIIYLLARLAWAVLSSSIRSPKTRDGAAAFSCHATAALVLEKTLRQSQLIFPKVSVQLKQSLSLHPSEGKALRSGLCEVVRGCSGPRWVW